VALVATALLSWGCGGRDDRGPRVGDPAPSYTVSTLNGDSISLADLRGEPVLLNFWATWCTPCKAETPFIESLYREYGKRGVQVVGVSLDSPESGDEVRSWIRKMGVTYRILRDGRQVALDRFSLVGIPATYLLDADGTIRFARLGPVSPGDRDLKAALRDVVS